MVSEARTVGDPRGGLEALSFHAVASQTAWGLGWTGVALFIGFAIKVLLTRRMAPAELGIVLAAQAFMGLVLVVAELGIPDAVVRYVGVEAASDTAPRRTVYVALKIVTSSALLASGLVLAGLFVWFGRAMSADALWTMAILALGLPLFALGDVIGAAYRGVNRLGTKLFMVDVARPGVVAIALLVSPVVVTRHASYVAGLYILGALVVLSGLWVLFRLDQHWRNVGVSTSSELLHFGVPVAGAAILAGPLVNGVLPTMLSAWTGSTAVAFYGIALALQGVVVLPIGLFEQVVLPTWARMAAQPASNGLAHSYQQYTNMCFAAAAGLGILLIANDTAVLVLLFGPEYTEASWALGCAIIATLFGAFTGPNEAMLRAIGATRPIFAARLTGAAAATAAGAILIPAHGLSGAVMAFAVACVAVNTLYGISLYLMRGIHPFTRRHSMTTLITIAGLLTATTLADIPSPGAWVAAHIMAILVVVTNADLRLAVHKLVRR